MINRVEEYLSGQRSVHEIATANGIGENTLRYWIKKYEEQGAVAFGEKTGNAKYSKEFKIQCVEAVIRGEGSVDDIVAKYNMSDSRVLRDWIKKYNANPENNQRCHDIDNKKSHSDIYRCHKHGAQKESHSQHDRILKHGRRGIVKMSEERKDPHKDNNPGSSCDHKECRQDGPEGRGFVQAEQYKTVKRKKPSQNRHNHADACPLPKVFLKGMKKGAGDITFFVQGHLLAAVEQSCGSRSYGKNRDTADEPQEIQPDAVDNLGDKLKNRAFRIK